MAVRFALIFGLIMLGNAAVAIAMNVLGAIVEVRAVAFCLAAVASGMVIAYFSDQLPDFSRLGNHRHSSESRR